MGQDRCLLHSWKTGPSYSTCYSLLSTRFLHKQRLSLVLNGCWDEDFTKVLDHQSPEAVGFYSECRHQ